MDYLWSPWRYQYLTKPVQPGECFLCAIQAPGQDDAENHIVLRGALNFIVLNAYPYSPGHLLIAPYEHVASLEAASEAVVGEMMQMARMAESRLRQVYRPQGLNLGMNLGQAGGAGVPGHIHLHVLPRWSGDTNFMTTIGDTRVLPESLDVTFEKLKKAFGASATSSTTER
jgi:ATP adenylyltransferase